MNKIFGKRLKELRQIKDEQQKDLAEQFNVSRSMISQWEIGIHYPEITKLIEIAEYYQVSIDYLLGLSDEKSYVQQKKSPDKTISEDEQELLDLYRRAGQNKQDVKNIAKGYATLNDLNNSVKNSNRA